MEDPKNCPRRGVQGPGPHLWYSQTLQNEDGGTRVVYQDWCINCGVNYHGPTKGTMWFEGRRRRVHNVISSL